MFYKRFPFTRQLESSDCGPVCLKMILAYYNKNVNVDWIKDKFEITKLGVGVVEIEEISIQLGMDAVAVKTSVEFLKSENPLPCILLWQRQHFVVLYKISNSNKGQLLFHIADPAFGLIKIPESRFSEMWSPDHKKGIALFLEPGASFEKLVISDKKKSSLEVPWQFIRHYLINNTGVLLLLSVLIGLGIGMTWIFPTMLRRMVDDGINNRNNTVLFTFLFSQLAVISGQIVVEWYRGVLSTKLSMKLSTKIIIDFIRKLSRLPVRFFDFRTNSDIIQRIEDHSRIESFLTGSIIQNIFQIIVYVIFSALLFTYSFKLFLFYNFGTIIAVIISFFYLHQINIINYQQFGLNFEYKNKLYELISGMIEIRLNNAEKRKINDLHNTIHNLYKVNTSSRQLQQKQALIVKSTNLIKNLGITIACAYWVIGQQMTLGIMLTIGFITGFLNSSVDSLLDFARSSQDAKLAIDRIQEIFKKKDEVTEGQTKNALMEGDCINIEKVSFKYPGLGHRFVLNEISIKIPTGKVTAIVGESGSGKTTLLKLLLGYYLPTSGNIYLGDTNLTSVNIDKWRELCSTVMQTGFIFSSTIEENIALGSSKIDEKKLKFSCEVACIDEFISSLPLHYKTKIGSSGINLSGGQIQRILIARAVYSNPEFIFFDEATSSLDSRNEKKIMHNLQYIFANKTVVVIAHRLSTVRKADQIIVLRNGTIVESGTHTSLVAVKGNYYELVKNQLELGG